MQAYVGTASKPHVLPVEKEVVRRFIEAVRDPNPLWSDEEYAKTTHYGGTIVPPHIFSAIVTIAACSSESGVIPIPVPEVPLPRTNVLEGEETWEYFAPLRIGDVITSTSTFTDVKRREGRLGEMFIMVYVAESVNQRGELVCRSINTIVNY
jgi:acyl dehydratase